MISLLAAVLAATVVGTNIVGNSIPTHVDVVNLLMWPAIVLAIIGVICCVVAIACRARTRDILIAAISLLCFFILFAVFIFKIAPNG